jgi:hypothetical protein
MLVTLGRAAVVAGIGALAAVAALVALYGTSPQLEFEMNRPTDGLLRGFHPAERDQAAALTFAWTMRRATIELPDLDRRSAWTAAIRLRGGRPDPASLPDVAITVDGLTAISRKASNQFEDFTIEIPEQGSRRGATIGLEVSNTFRPGAKDGRQLGVVVDRIVISPSQRFVLPPRRTLAGAALAGLFEGAAFGFAGLTAAAAAGAALVLGVLLAIPISMGLGPYTDFAQTAARISFWVGLGIVAVTRGLEAGRAGRLRQTARFVLGFSGAALLLKLLVLYHPGLFIGDALFQAHRFQSVLRGRYYFTSIAPGEYEFPYAIALYVASIPFSWFVRVAEHVQLLRTVTAVADTVAGGLLYLIVSKSSGDRLAGAMAVALYHLVPIGFDVQTTGNLTNVFGQSLFLVALTLVLAAPLSPVRVSTVGRLAAALAAAFMAHTSTFAILLVMALTIGTLFRIRGDTTLRLAGNSVLIAAAVALILAVAIYYGHFGEVYEEQFSRISGELAGAPVPPEQGRRTAAVRAIALPYRALSGFGLPVMLMAVVGLWRLESLGGKSRLAVGLVGWLFTCAAFLVLGVVTPVDMRSLLAAFPALAILAGLGAAWAWRTAGWPRIAAVGMLSWAIWVGASEWLRTIA